MIQMIYFIVALLLLIVYLNYGTIEPCAIAEQVTGYTFGRSKNMPIDCIRHLSTYNNG